MRKFPAVVQDSHNYWRWNGVERSKVAVIDDATDWILRRPRMRWMDHECRAQNASWRSCVHAASDDRELNPDTSTSITSSTSFTSYHDEINLRRMYCTATPADTVMVVLFRLEPLCQPGLSPSSPSSKWKGERKHGEEPEVAEVAVVETRKGGARERGR